MKKTLIASAVAAAALTTNAFAMDPATDLAEKLDSMPTFYGNIQLAYINNEIENDTNSNIAAGADGGLSHPDSCSPSLAVASKKSESCNGTIDNGSTLGVMHSHAISEELTGFLKAEMEFGADDKGSSGGLNTLDEAYIGVKSDTHSVQIGSDDTVFEWVDIIDFSEAVGDSIDLAGVDEGDNLQYVGTFDNLKVGATIALDSDTNDAGALAVEYSMDNISIIGTYAMGREEGGYSENNPITGAPVFTNVTLDKGDTFGLAGTISLEDLTLGLAYVAQDDSDVVDTVAKEENATSSLGLMGSYAMGALSFTGTYTMATTDFGAAGDTDQDTLVLQSLYNVSDNMYAYVEYATSTVDIEGAGGDWTYNALAIGAAYSF